MTQAKVPISSVARLFGGGTPPRSNSNFFGGEIPWVTPTDLPPIGEVSVLGDVPGSLTREGLAASSACLLPVPVVLYSSRATIGKIVVAEQPCATNQGFISFVPNTEVLDPWFLAYYLCYKTPEILKLAGETTYKEVSRGKMKDFPVWLPPMPVQQSAVKLIRDCHERIAQIAPMREAAESEAKALFCSAINSMIAVEWPLRRLADICIDIRNGWSGKQSPDANKVGVLRLSCVHSLEIDDSDVKQVELNDRVSAQFAVRAMDVFVVRGNGSRHLVGRSAIAVRDRSDVIFNDLLIRLRFGSEVIPDFANYMLHSTSARDQIEKLSRTAAGIWKINQTNLGLVQIPCPQIVVQQSIVAALHEAKAISDNLSRTITEVDLGGLRRGILRQAFAGEL